MNIDTNKLLAEMRRIQMELVKRDGDLNDWSKGYSAGFYGAIESLDRCIRMMEPNPFPQHASLMHVDSEGYATGTMKQVDIRTSTMKRVDI